MAGILSNSASVTMVTGTADNTQSGFISQEQVTLSTTPSASSYTWGLSKPSNATVRSDLSSTSTSTPVFTPDVAGTYVVTCTADGTSYVLRMTVTSSAVTSVANVHRMSPVTDSSVPTPAQGQSLFVSSTYGDGLSVKDEVGSLRRLGWKRKGSNLTDANATLQFSEGELRILPASTLSANRILTLGVTGARLGAELTLRRVDTEAFTLAVANGGPGAGTLVTLPVGQAWWLTVRFDGTDWELMTMGQFV